MVSFKLLPQVVLTLSLLLSVSLPVEGSEEGKRDGGEGKGDLLRRSPRTSVATLTEDEAQTGARMPQVNEEDLNFFYSETSTQRCRRESALMHLPETADSSLRYVPDVEWDDLQSRTRTFPPADYMRLANAPENTGAYYYPLVIDEEKELENQENPDNFMGRIMARYRRDMGFNPRNFPGEIDVDEEEVAAFLRCFADTPASIFSERLDFMQAIAEYAFLQNIGLIPARFAGCEALGLRSFAEFKKVYEEKIRAYTFIDWNLLDLTRFRGLKFPIFEKFINTFDIIYETKTYTTPMVLSTLGRSALTRYVNQIRFHNPRTIEGRRMLLFQRIYRRYCAEVDAYTCDANFIDWNRWNVSRWPEGMSQSDMTTWTDEQITHLNEWINAGYINFHSRNLSSKHCPGPLRIPSSHCHNDLEPVAYSNYDLIGSEKIEISDDEAICGGHPRNPSAVRKFYKFRRAEEARWKTLSEALLKEERAKEKEANRKRKRAAEKEDKLTDNSNGKESAKSPSNGIRRARNTDPVYVYSDDEEFDENTFGKAKQQQQSSSRSPSASSKPKSSGDRKAKKGEFVKTVSATLPDPIQRQQVLQRALEIFRKDTRSPQATTIDWSLIMVRQFENHLLAFSTGLETEGDVITLSDLMDFNYVRFLNLSVLRDRRIRAFEILYQAYSKACGKYPHKYDIYFGDVEFEGIPEDLPADERDWSKEEVEHIFKSYAEGRIECRRTEEFDQAIREIEAELAAKLAAESAMQIEKEVGMIHKSSSFAFTSSTDDSDEKSELSFEQKQQQQPEKARMFAKFSVSTSVAAKKSSKKTPNYVAELSKNSPQPGMKSFAFDEDAEFDADIKVNPVSAVAVTAGPVATNGAFAGSFMADIRAFLVDLEANILSAITARFRHDPSSRHYRIFTEIIRALKLLHQHGQHSLVPHLAVMPSIDYAEINGYLRAFHAALRNIDVNGELPASYLRNFIVDRTMLRARLEGIRFTTDSLGVQKLDLKKPQILGGAGMCDFLTRHPGTWDLELLEIMLDAEDEPFFSPPASSKKQQSKK